MRKRSRRKVIVPLPPPGMRPKLEAHRVRDLDILHHVNLDTIARGQAEPAMLWDMAGGVLTWHRAALLTGIGIPEMEEQQAMAVSVIERFKRTGRVGFSGTELEVARRGVGVMDALAKTVDKAVAYEASAWAEDEINRIIAALEC